MKDQPHHGRYTFRFFSSIFRMERICRGENAYRYIPGRGADDYTQIQSGQAGRGKHYSLFQHRGTMASSSARTALANSEVPAVPPRSLVFIPRAIVALIACSTSPQDACSPIW